MNGTQMEDNSIKFWAGFITAVAGAVITIDKFCEYMQPRMSKWALKKAWAEYLEECGKVQREMDAMRDIHGVERVLFFKAVNCGGFPKLGCKMTTSTLLWSISDSTMHRFPAGGYQDTPLDGHYMKLLQSLQENGVIHVDPENLDHSSQIGRVYHAEKIVDSYWFSLGVKDRSFLYLSVSTSSIKFDEDTRTAMDVHVHNIKARIK